MMLYFFEWFGLISVDDLLVFVLYLLEIDVFDELGEGVVL